MKAFEEAASMMRGLVDGSVRSQYPPGSTLLTTEKSDRIS
jgi:hypothetical protein